MGDVKEHDNNTFIKEGCQKTGTENITERSKKKNYGQGSILNFPHT